MKHNDVRHLIALREEVSMKWCMLCLGMFKSKRCKMEDLCMVPLMMAVRVMGGGCSNLILGDGG